MDDMYHEGESTPFTNTNWHNEADFAITGEGKFEDASHEASGAATPMAGGEAAEGPPAKKRKAGMSKKAKTVKQRLAVIDGEVG